AFREIAPAPFVAEFAIERFPALGFFLGVQQREFCALDDGNVGAAGDFEQAQSALGLFSYPLVAADGGNSKHVKLFRLQENEDGLHVGGGRPARVLIDDDLDLLRLQPGGGSQNQNSGQQDSEASWLHGAPLGVLVLL